MTNDLTEHFFSVMIVGDEILSARRKDKHMDYVIELFKNRDLNLCKVTFLPDNREFLAKEFSKSFKSKDIVFCFGGIGSTPDDHTRQAVSMALNLPLVLHPIAKEIIIRHCEKISNEKKSLLDMSTSENKRRLQMGFFPEGSEIVENHYNQIPGFFIKNHTFLPGFPIMSWPMIKNVLDTRYKKFQFLSKKDEQSFFAYKIPESRITPFLEEAEKKFPDIKVFSLPNIGDSEKISCIELGVKGLPEFTGLALDFLKKSVYDLGGVISEN